jgi:hypothetical protein
MGEPDEEAHEDENDVSQSSFRSASISMGERDQRLPRERSDGFSGTDSVIFHIYRSVLLLYV